MGTIQERWIWGLLDNAWERARKQLQIGLSDLARLYRLFQDDVENRLRSLETSAVIGRISATGATTINSTTATSLAGVVTTITPDRDCVALVTGVFDVAGTALPSGVTSILVLELRVNAVAQAAQALFAPSIVNERMTTSQIWVVPMTGGTAYGLLATGRLNAPGNTYNVAGTHSGLAAVLVA